MQDGGTYFLGRLQAVFLVGGSDAIDQEAIPVDEVLELVANRVAGTADSDRLHHARVPQLFTAQLAVEQLERERKFYLTTHSTHFIYGYMASDIWLRTTQIVRQDTRCCHIGYSYRLTAWVLLYAPSHRQDNTYHGLCYTSRRALAGTRNSSMGPPHEGSIR